jgi:O-antigen/teichoic acid export membrane protein
VRTPLLFVLGWLVASLLSGSRPLVHFVYDARAAEAAWMIPLLALGGYFAVLENAYTTALLSVGVPNWSAYANAAKVGGMFVLIPLGYGLFGFPGAIAGFSAADVFKYLVAAAGARRHGLYAIRQEAGFAAAIAATAALGLALGGWLEGRDLASLVAGDGSPALQVRLTALLQGAPVALLQAGLWGAAFVLWNRRRRAR